MRPDSERELGLAHEARALLGIWIREFTVYKREKSRVISSLFQPLLWIAFVGAGLQGAVDPSKLGGIDYQSFIFPGILVMAVLFGTIFHGLYIIWDRKLDVLKEILVAPVSRATVFTGKVLGGATEAILQSLIILLIAVGLSLWAPFPFAVALRETPLWRLLPSLGIVLLTAVTFTSVGLLIGSRFESLEGFQVVVSFLAFPLFFLSGALYPLEAPGFPSWLGVLARVNPVTYSVDALRGLLIGRHLFPYALDVGALIFTSAVAVALGSWSFSRMK